MGTHSTEGRCVSCGYLAKFDFHHDGPPPYIYELPTNDRATGGISRIRLEKDREISGFPQCYVNAVNIWSLIQEARRKESNEALATKRILDADRQCAKWCQYTQGFSPQHHWEQIKMLELELKRQEFERQMEKDRKEFETHLSQMSRDAANQHETANRRLQWFLGIVAALIGLIQMAFPNGWPWLMRFFGSDTIPTIPPY